MQDIFVHDNISKSLIYKKKLTLFQLFYFNAAHSFFTQCEWNKVILVNFRILVMQYTHARTWYTHAHLPRVHARTIANAHTHARKRNARICAQMHSYARKCKQMHVHASNLTHSSSKHTQMCAHARTQAQIHEQAPKCVYGHTCARTHTLCYDVC